MDQNDKMSTPSPTVLTEFPIKTSANFLVRHSNPDSQFKHKFKALTLHKAI